MANGSRGPGGPRLLAFVALLIALPGILAETGATPIPPNAPPALDRFLAAVRAATPPTARVLVAGSPPALVFYRATYLLYPRTVYTALPTDYAHGWVAPPIGWATLLSQARRDKARYVLLWGLSVQPRGSVRLRSGPGMLVEAQP